MLIRSNVHKPLFEMYLDCYCANVQLLAYILGLSNLSVTLGPIFRRGYRLQKK